MNADAILKVLDELGKRMAGPAEQVWAIYLKQTIVFGVVDIVCGLGLFCFSAWAIKKLLSRNEYGNLIYSDAEWLFAWAGAVSANIWGLSLIIYGSMYCANPVYWVLKDLSQIVIK